MKNVFKKLLTTTICFVIVHLIQAGDLFEIEMTSPGVTPVTVTGSSLADLVSKAIKSENGFFAFADRDRTATFKYAGVENAIQITINAGETSATLEVPITGFAKTFSGASSDELKNQVVDFLKKDGTAQLANFYREINAGSLVAVTDGNPHSSTALLADRAYDQFGMTIGQTREEKEHFKKSSGGFSITLEPQAGQIEANGFKGVSASLP